MLHILKGFLSASWAYLGKGFARNLQKTAAN